MYLLIIFLPLIGSFIGGFGGFALGHKGTIRVTLVCMFSVLFSSFIVFYEVGLAGSPCSFIVMKWIDSELFSINWGFLFDSLTVVMLIVVNVVSFLVHLYSTEYMSTDPHLSRFMSYLSLFTFFMIILVTADNLLQMFVGWEGVGLCSYLLINFWFTRLQANKAAIKAVIVNRVGDFGLALAIFLILDTFKSLNYSSIFALAPYFKDAHIKFLTFECHTITLICFFLFIGAVGKSAQLGLHTWLPDAMEGPTPVSALIHAATMVTAGVFLIARCSPLFEYSTKMLCIITIVGALTAFFAATTGLVQNDLKRVIAYSTCSQLGYMVFACGVSNYPVSVFHLANHAFFKALLFLSAGSIIHSMVDEQDMRRMGGLLHILPFTYSMVLIGSLALMGFPFLAGFYSKDVILEVAYSRYTIQSHFAFWLGSFSAFCTSFYSIRLIFLTFLSEVNAYKNTIENSHDAPIIMAIPLFILSWGSIFIGFLTRDMMIGLGTDFWGNALFTAPINSCLVDAEFLPLRIKLLPLIFSCLGASFSFLFFYSMPYSKIKFDFSFKLYTFLNRKWFFDKYYNEFINQKLLFLGYRITYKIIDRGLIEILGPKGLSVAIYSLATKLNKLNRGPIYIHLFWKFTGICFFFFIPYTTPTIVILLFYYYAFIIK